MAGVTVKIVGKKEVEKKLEKLSEKGKNLEPAFHKIGQELDLTTRDRFDSETGPDGKKWKELKKETKQQKKRQGLSSKILHGHKNLRDSFSYKSTPSNLIFGTNLIYGATHQFGDSGRNIDARAFLGLNATRFETSETRA